MKVLAIGLNAAHFAREIFPDAQVDQSDIMPGKKRSGYDTVIGYMCLQTVAPDHVMDTVKKWVACLKDGGSLTVLVPSLEWAAVQILLNDKSPVLYAHLFGENNRSGFTMLDLRSVLSMAGVAVTHAATGTYTIGEYEAELHTARGIKK